jgi:hypothetical protein
MPLDWVLFTAESLGKQMGLFAGERLQAAVVIARGGNHGLFARYHSRPAEMPDASLTGGNHVNSVENRL